MRKISSITKNLFYLISNELNNFTNYLNNILNSNENLKLKNFLILFFTLSFFFIFFFVIYGLKIRLFNPIFEDDFHILSLEISDISKIVNSPRPVGYILAAITNLFPMRTRLRNREMRNLSLSRRVICVLKSRKVNT